LLKATSHAGAKHFIKRYTRRFRKPIERPHPTDEDLDRLRDALFDDTEKLRALTGLSFSNWGI
jgi:hypothetical protein